MLQQARRVGGRGRLLFTGSYVALLAGLTAGCGESGTDPGPTAPPAPPPLADLAVSKEHGDGQVRFPGTELVGELGILVAAADGSRVGVLVPVTWTVVSGDGVITESDADTGGFGRASARLTLGPTEGETQVKAEVEDVGSVMFTAKAKKQGGPIAFASSRFGSSFWNWHIFVMETDGSDVMAVTSGPFIAYRPAWSPDGQRIAFTRDSDSGGGGIFVVNADGTGETQLTSDGVSGHPRWSPDGSKIAYSRGDWNDLHIWTMNADGSGQKELTWLSPSFTGDLDPDWSPDGSKIVFSRAVPSCGPICVTERDIEIYVMNADGTEITQLTHDGVANFLPYWSPDGTRIMYQRSWTGPDEVWIMNADGSDPRKLTTSLPGSWSPDGSHVLVFDTGVGRDALWDVFKVDVATGERTNLTEHDAEDNWPVWRW